MIDIDELAIADVFFRNKLGIVSFQPDIREEYSNDSLIPVRDIHFELYFIKLENCYKLSSEKDKEKYWEIVNKL